MKFTEMTLSESTLDALQKKWFETASPIQATCIPLLLEGKHDVIGQAQTWTGKTAAFSIPLIEQIDTSSKHTQALVLAPTRELAIQVAEDIADLKGKKRLSVAVVYGWASMPQQIRKLKAGAQIVVGTPGRVMDHLNRGTLKIDNLSFFVLDEADEMLNMWFEEDISQILSVTNDDKQMLFFSATMPREILKIATSYMRKGYEVIKVKAEQLTTVNTEQIYIEVYASDKNEALSRIIDSEVDMYSIIFCKTRRECDQLAERLNNRWYAADSLHGDMDQREREKVMNSFKLKQCTLLVATDVAARGIDVNDLTHVINYQIPQNAESYTHRIGRTGRAGKQWVAITLVTPAEYKKLLYIQRTTKSDIAKKTVPEVAQIIEIRKNHILQKVTEVAHNAETKQFEEIANKLIKEVDNEQLVYWLLTIAFGDELDESSYRSIKTVDRSNLANTRLFIARGRNSWMWPKELVDWIKKESDLQDKDINDVRIFDEFSFITCPFAEAELLIQMFKKKWQGGRPLIKEAKNKWDRSGWRGRWRSGGYRWWNRWGNRGWNGGWNRSRSSNNSSHNRRGSR